MMMMSLLCRCMLVVAATLLQGRVHCLDPVVEFNINEERAVGLELGSLGDDNVLPLGLDPAIRGSLRYSLLPQGFPRSSLFRVDEDSGQIFSKERIDRESLCGLDPKCDLDIQVAVQSAVSQFFKKVKVTVKVKDINDNSPTFPRPTVQLNILESVATGTSFPLQEATDLDIGDFGVKDYELTPSSGAFYVSLTKGEGGRNLVSLLVRQELDLETVPVHNLLLIARDGGQPALTGTVSLVIHVDDVNDNAPVFDHQLYNVSLPETAIVGTQVTSVTATDFDSEPYGVKEYRFSPLGRDDVTKYFAINTSTGDITVAGSLLEKQGETFRMLIECMDKGFPPLVSRTEVAVTVEDTANSAPMINLNTMFGGSVSEMAQSGTVVALLGVIDRDAGLNGAVSCSIVSDAFELQTLAINEYKVIVVRKLDREAEPVHEVSVLCQDAGSPPLSGTVTFNVKVKDENDNFPVFSEMLYQKSVPENNRPGQILLRVTAEDSDVGENARITYGLIGTSDLRVDTRGNIIAVNGLDRERTYQLKFRATATDNGTERRSTTVDVIIDVTDVNDEVPTFEKDLYELRVMENMPANTTVGVVKATDKDAGDNAVISYTIWPRDSPFDVTTDGAIVTKETLDREQLEHYTLTLRATDRGQPALTGTATVLVTVGDQNDHTPRIVYPRSGNSSVVLAFDARPGSVVLSIITEDHDAGVNKHLEYHLASSSGRSMFELSKDKGDLILRRSLTLLDIGRHRLTVAVTDQSPTVPLASNSSFDVIIFAPNETESPARDKEKEHVMVVIILGAVTGMVTVAVVITIVIIRRADDQRRKYLKTRVKVTPDVQKYESEKLSVGYVISNSVPDGSKTKGDKDSGRDTSRDQADEGFGEKSFNTSHGSGGVSDQTEWSKAVRLHQDLLRLHGVDRAFRVQDGLNDDVTSDGSEESTTCDSGRGGSEEDNGSQGRQSPLVNKDGFLTNNLNRANRSPAPQQMTNIPRFTFAHLTGRQPLDLAHLPSQTAPRSVPAPPTKHVSFRDDIRHELSEQLPANLWAQRFPNNITTGGWNSPTTVASTEGQRAGFHDTRLNLDHSFDDGNSTTTSGSYTVDDLSLRDVNAGYLTEQAMV